MNRKVPGDSQPLDAGPTWEHTGRSGRVARKFLRIVGGPRGLSYVAALATSVVALQTVIVAGTRGVPSSLLLFLAAVTLTARHGGSRAAVPVATLAIGMNTWFAILAMSGGAVPVLFSVVQIGAFIIVTASIVVYNDRRLRAQRELVDHAGFIEAMTRDPEEGICTLDGNGCVTSLNAAAETLLAGSADDLFGADLHALLHTAEVEVCGGNREDCPFGALFQPGRSVQTGEVDIVREGGSHRRLAYTSSPILIGGQPRGTVLSLRDVTRHRTEVQSLREREEQYRRLIESSPDGMVLTDVYGYITEANRAAAALYGYGAMDEMIGLRHVQHVVPEDRGRYSEDGSRALAGGTVQTTEHRGLKKDGSTFGGEIRMSPILDESGKAIALVQVCRDVSDRHRAQMTAKAVAARAAMEQSIGAVLSQSITLGDATSNVVRTVCQHAAWDIGMLWMPESADGSLHCHTVWHPPEFNPLGFDELSRGLTIGRDDEIPGRVWATGAASWISDVRSDPDFSRALIASKAGLQTAICIPIMIGTTVRAVLECLSREVREENLELLSVMTGVAAQFAQFIERKDAEAALHHQARHDALTGLPNRVLLGERVERALVVSRGQRQPLTLLLMDLDRFKQVNDTMGHHQGDALLQQVSLRLRDTLRESDTVARLGGDEFSALLPNTDAAEAGIVADKILAALCQPFVLEGQTIEVGASIGISIFPVHGDTVNALMQKADIAMYAAKRSHAGVVVYAADQDENSPTRLMLMADLREAIEEERITVHYQPKANFRTGQIESVEALARWHHPDQGLIMPDQFIPLAEQSGLIKPLSYCVLNQALRQRRLWEDAGLSLTVAVNLSVENLHDPHLVEVVSELLKTHDLDGSCLMLEITETAVMVDSARAAETLDRLHDIGVRAALDDFGTGYSALTYLKRLPVDQIKIDKSFVLEMAGDANDAFIAQAVINLGHNLGVEVVAEGVATQDAWRTLDTMGCDHAQGFYLSRPLPANELTAWLEQARLQSEMRSIRIRETGA